jgi:hypothetical protein
VLKRRKMVKNTSGTFRNTKKTKKQTKAIIVKEETKVEEEERQRDCREQ